MILLYFWPFLLYFFDGVVVIALIQALGEDDLDFVVLAVIGVATIVLSVFLDLMLANEFGLPGFFGACSVTAIALGAALKLIWDLQPKRVALICIFFCAFHVGLLRILLQWQG